MSGINAFRNFLHSYKFKIKEAMLLLFVEMYGNFTLSFVSSHIGFVIEC